MDSLFASGRIVDIILVLMVIEAVVLIAYHRRSGAGIKTRHVLSNLIAGMCLFMALKLALTDAPWQWIGAGLTAALGAHLVDLRSRWRDN